MPRPHFTPGKDPVPILQEDGLAPGPVRTGKKSRPHWDSIPDRPARSQSLSQLSYRAHGHTLDNIKADLQETGWNITAWIDLAQDWCHGGLLQTR